MKISELFSIDVARSRSSEDYDSGDTPFVTNTVLNNGVSSYVTPFQSDKVFTGPAICISGLGYATVQMNTFLPKGNGGDSATILLPLRNSNIEELLFYAALFNYLHGWRFSFGRKGSKNRIKDLVLEPLFNEVTIDFNSLLLEFSSNMQAKLLEYQQQYVDSLNT